MRKIRAIALTVSYLMLLQFSAAQGAASKAASLPIPITLPVAQSGTITFANAEANFAAIPEAAWQRTQDVIAANPAVNIPTVINIGPNTKASKTAITDGLDRINKLFAGFRHVSAYAGIVYNAKDLNWAQGATAAYLKKLKVSGGSASAESTKRSSEAGCEIQGGKAINCYGGMSWDLRDTKSQAGGSWYGVETAEVNGKPLDFWTDENKNSVAMTQVTHEAAHNYQITQFFYTPLAKGQYRSNDQSRAFVPWWFGEGHANAIGIATFLDSFDAYREARSQNITRNPGSRTKLPAFNAAALKTLLTSKGVASPENPNYALGYSIGYAAVEALVAIGGPQATLALYTLGAKGQKWETAFKNVYGITWDEGATVLSKVLVAEYAVNPIMK